MITLAEYAKAHQIEQIMALVGRSLQHSREYRRELEQMTGAELADELRKIENEIERGEQ